MLETIHSAAFQATLKLFGGWSGLCAFYFAVLAFPLYYSKRTLQDHAQNTTALQSHQLRTAGLIVLTSSAICYALPSEIYLQPHVASDRHMHARLLDWTFHLLIAYLFAPLVGFFRLKHTTQLDSSSLTHDLPNPSLTTLTPETASRINTLTAKYHSESTWLLLFTLYFLNLPAGLLSICLGNILAKTTLIPWYLFPLYNLSGHIAVCNAVVGLLEALYHPVRIEALALALACETREERAAFWSWMLDALFTEKMLARIVVGRRDRLTDLERNGRGRFPMPRISRAEAEKYPLLGVFMDEKLAFRAQEIVSLGLQGGEKTVDEEMEANVLVEVRVRDEEDRGLTGLAEQVFSLQRLEQARSDALSVDCWAGARCV